MKSPNLTWSRAEWLGSGSARASRGPIPSNSGSNGSNAKPMVPTFAESSDRVLQVIHWVGGEGFHEFPEEPTPYTVSPNA